MILRLLLSVLLCVSAPALAAVTETGTATVYTDVGSNTAFSQSKVVTGGSNTCLTVQLSYYNGSGAVAPPTLSWNTSEAFTTVASASNAGGDYRSAVYFLANPTGGTLNVTGTFSNTALWRSTISEWANCGGQHGGANANGSSTTPSVNVPSVVTGEVTLDALTNGGGSVGTAGAGQSATGRHTGQLAGSIYGVGSLDNSTTGTVTESWTISSADWALSAMALTESAGGGATVKTLSLMGVGQ